MIEWGVAACAETDLAALTLQGLDMPVFSSLPIPHQGMYRFVGDTEVPAVRVGTGMPLGLDAFLAPTVAFALTPGPHVASDWPDRYL